MPVRVRWFDMAGFRRIGKREITSEKYNQPINGCIKRLLKKLYGSHGNDIRIIKA